MTTSTTAGIYVRISRDPEGLKLGVDRQREDCLALAAREKWHVVDLYADNDISASRFGKKRRPEFARMMSDAEGGRLEVIVAYSSSRLTRRPLELEDLISLHERTGVRIATVVSGADDLGTADGRMIARIKGSIDAGEVERQGERLRRMHKQRAESGRAFHGGRPFGWADDKINLDPAEAELIREAVRRLLHGEAIRSIVRDWAGRGVKTSRGGEFLHTTLRRMLRRPRLAGLVVRKGEVLLDRHGDPVIGEWVPILDRDTFDRLQAVLARDTRGGARAGARKYLLTGLMRCGGCGGRMTGTKTGSGFAYTCEGGAAQEHSCTITGAPTEAAVLALLRARLDGRALPEPDPEPVHDHGEARLAEIAGLVDELMAAFRAKQLSGGLVFAEIEALEAEAADLRAARARRLDVPAAPVGVTLDDFDDLDTDRQRALLAVDIRSIVVAPVGRRGGPFKPERLSIVWAEGS